MVNTDFYSNAKIYKIVDNTNNIYIGSTCKKLCQRLAQHRANYKQYLEGFTTSFKISLTAYSFIDRKTIASDHICKNA